ncbi:hypothetical protein THAOC_00070 [Thalassiosira oceanica]|uniref:Uncharacterized protein n=1 Tax=Thalassiosira oceanica TaxID=159749 RepID=K0TRM5_THAOC|nr:hypothetical protein THAOC_00070 [Thalassiosira oceanica]|eukprot:EJK78057.1 hypothetical protein THAOC_00070 [Thalassiosira oceanica]
MPTTTSTRNKLGPSAMLSANISQWKTYGKRLKTELVSKEAEVAKLKGKNAKNQARVARQDTCIAQWKLYGTGLMTKVAANLTKSKLEAAEVMVFQWSEYGRKLQAQLAGKDAEIKKLKSKRMDISALI